MSVLTNDIITEEQIPLAGLGVQVFDMGPEHTRAQTAFVKSLRRHINEDIGLTYSMKSIFKLAKQEYPPAVGMDVWSNGPGISRVLGTCTLPPHYICRVMGPVWIRFMLIAPGIEFDSTDVHYMGKCKYDYISYAKMFKEISEETLLNITGTKDSLSTIGTCVRDDYMWKPISIENAERLVYKE